ncbi:hypothetical protein [Pelagicoccus sp. SDUM812002]|uniref:hypothetical protein n=1 Tax=Pelagicoccus sp. SDUM812002 TaxID=3041266 RepID=UPI00281254C7|nr:hypothetical protein [Pelagicoccus sp. SDUM812002]
MGPSGVDIFLRETQSVWTEFYPYVDRRSCHGAELLGLPTAPDQLGSLSRNPSELVSLLAALVRVSLGKAEGELASLVKKAP